LWKETGILLHFTSEETHQTYLKICVMLSALSMKTERKGGKNREKEKKKRKEKHIGTESFIRVRAYCQTSAETS